MYRYETHLHTAPVSKCAGAGVRETLYFYKKLGYDGVFITNHFLDSNIRIEFSRPYDEKIEFYLSDYFEAKKEGDKIGLKVFFGVELSYLGTDFLVYGLSPDWYRAHPEIMDMDKRTELAFMRAEGGYVVHAHPYREAGYIDHIRLYPRSIDAVETNNACRTDFENRMAKLYAENYGFPETAGSDNHHAFREHLAGMETEQPLECEADYVNAMREGKAKIFTAEAERSTHEWISKDSEGLINVHLFSNPTTGYDWQWSCEGDCTLEEISKEYERKEDGKMLAGAPAFLKIRFKAYNPGAGVLTLRYMRCWENNPPLRTFRLDFRLLDDGRLVFVKHDFTE